MKTDEKHKQLRELIIDEIHKTGSPYKPSRTVLKKKDDSSLVGILFDCAVAAEQEFWKDDIVKAASLLNPKAKISRNSTSGYLINRLIKISQEAKDE